MKKYLPILLFCISILLLMFVARGDISDGTLAFQTELNKSVGGPFESSNSSSRYALVQALVEQKSVFLTDNLAKFASPDLVFHNNKFTSIFLPGVSLLAAPLYSLGTLFKMPQLVTFALNPMMGIIAMYLISKLSRLFGAKYWHAMLAGFVFLFATNALPYTQTLTQHLPSTVILLAATIIAFSGLSTQRNILFGFLFSLAAIIDIPNLFMFVPLLIAMAIKHISVAKILQRNRITIHFSWLWICVGALPLVVFFGWYNNVITGSYTKIGQFIGRVNYEDAYKYINYVEPEKIESPYEKHLAFNTRLLVQGGYILLVSNERGILYYQPIIIIGIAGMILLYKQKRYHQNLQVILAVIIMNFLIYMMFGDPWGGWSFGPRYLIPATALLSVFIGPALSGIKKQYIIAPVFFLLCVYSIYVNSLGVVTTNIVPPKGEAEQLVEPIPYTYQYNVNLLKEGKSSVLIYNSYFHRYVTTTQYFYWYMSSISTMTVLLYLLALREKQKGSYTL